ncbi:MAG: MlaE family ABC transporter permease [Oligoflexia bacterium]
MSIVDTMQSVTRISGGIALLGAQAIADLFRRRIHWGLVIEQINRMGIESIGLVLVTALATGSVMALQFGYGMAKFGAKLYVPKVVALTIAREMGPVFTSLLVAGRIGSGIAAEVASMKVTQQIDAMQALGTSPVQRIVLPRLLAAMITLPILTLLADWVCLFGGMLVASSELGIHAGFYWAKTVDTLRIIDLTTGMAKTAVFAAFISLAACWRGLNTDGGTQGVGSSTTWVVVVSSIFIMISDFFMTKLFLLTVFPKL